jgi:hypothetical protein
MSPIRAAQSSVVFDQRFEVGAGLKEQEQPVEGGPLYQLTSASTNQSLQV